MDSIEMDHLYNCGLGRGDEVHGLHVNTGRNIGQARMRQNRRIETNQRCQVRSRWWFSAASYLST